MKMSGQFHTLQPEKERTVFTGQQAEFPHSRPGHRCPYRQPKTPPSIT
jgi:hypothetical protein